MVGSPVVVGLRTVGVWVDIKSNSSFWDEAWRYHDYRKAYGKTILSREKTLHEVWTGYLKMNGTKKLYFIPKGV